MLNPHIHYKTEVNGETSYIGFKNEAYDRYEEHKLKGSKNVRLIYQDDIGAIVLKKVG